MESRIFIENAKSMMTKIRNVTFLTSDKDKATLQQEINDLFSELQNPSLISAFNLKEAATNAGFTVNKHIVRAIDQFSKTSN